MDMTYATIPVFNQPRRLYRESHMKYMVSSQERPENSPIYSIHTDLDSFILFNYETFNEQGCRQETSTNLVATSHPNMVANIGKDKEKGKLPK